MSENSRINIPLWQLVIRWIVLLPLAVLTQIFIYGISLILINWSIKNFCPFFPSLLLIWPASVISSGAYIFIGAVVAPKYRGYVALALLIIHVSIGASAIGLFLSGAISNTTGWELFISFFGGIVGSAFAVVHVIKTLGWEGRCSVSSLWVSK